MAEPVFSTLRRSELSLRDHRTVTRSLSPRSRRTLSTRFDVRAMALLFELSADPGSNTEVRHAGAARRSFITSTGDVRKEWC